MIKELKESGRKLMKGKVVPEILYNQLEKYTRIKKIMSIKFKIEIQQKMKEYIIHLQNALELVEIQENELTK